MNTKTSTRSPGFSLVELMLVVVIISLLAMVAIPSYQESVYRSRRADAHAALMGMQLLQEKWRSVHTSYATLNSLATIGASSTSNDGYYTLAISGNSSTAFTVTATPTGVQASDSCASIQLNQNGPVQTSEDAKKCWNR